jgi:hypothetical protein
MRSTVAAVVLATAVPALASPGHGYAVGSIQSRQAAENASLACVSSRLDSDSKPLMKPVDSRY